MSAGEDNDPSPLTLQNVAMDAAQLSGEERKQFVAGMAQRLHEKTGLPIDVIIQIIMQLLPLILGGCKKPTNVQDAHALLSFAAQRHPDVCPIFYRSAFRQNGVRDKDDINDLWSNFIVDANDNAPMAARVIMSTGQ